MHIYRQDQALQEDLDKLSEYITKPKSITFIPEELPVNVSPTVNKNRLCFSMTRFPGESTTVCEEARCTWLSAARHERTRRTRTLCSEGKQSKKHSDTSPLPGKREVKFHPLGSRENWLGSLMQIKSSTLRNTDWRRADKSCQDQTGLFQKI